MSFFDLGAGGSGKLKGGEKGNSGGMGSANQVIAKIYTWETTHKIFMCRDFREVRGIEGVNQIGI